MQQPEMILRHLLQHDHVGIGLVEKFVDAVDPVVVEAEVEGHNAQEPLGVGRCFGGGAMQACEDATDIDCRQHPGQSD